MSRTKTVLVLGAGASAPYGFPVGQRLYDEVLELTTIERREQRDAVLKITYADPGDLDRFCTDLRMSGFDSVDAFLENRSDWLAMGKAAMAAVLVKYERENALHPAKRDRKAGHWYHKLRQRLDTELKDGDPSVSVVTFNYDRSLEFWLLYAWKSTHGLRRPDDAERVRRVPIVHVQGKLGELPWESDINHARPYKPCLNPTSIRKAADGIRLIHEEADDDTGLKKARELIAAADKICFLGFGYQETNVKRLQLGEVKDGACVMGTMYGMKPVARVTAHRLLEGELGQERGSSRRQEGKVELSILQAEEEWDIAEFLNHRDVFS